MTCMLCILENTVVCRLIVCLNVNTNCLAFHTGTLAAFAHYLSFALLVVGLPLR